MRAGREEALQQARAELQALSERWLAAIEQWEIRRERLQADAREDVLQLAFALGERIVHRLLRVDSTIVRDQLIAALRLIGRPSALQVSVHPDDRAVIEEVMPDVHAVLGRSAHVHLADDPAISVRAALRQATNGSRRGLSANSGEICCLELVGCEVGTSLNPEAVFGDRLRVLQLPRRLSWSLDQGQKLDGLAILVSINNVTEMVPRSDPKVVTDHH
jgi:hypothetical protein